MAVAPLLAEEFEFSSLMLPLRVTDLRQEGLLQDTKELVLYTKKREKGLNAQCK